MIHCIRMDGGKVSTMTGITVARSKFTNSQANQTAVGIMTGCTIIMDLGIQGINQCICMTGSTLGSSGGYDADVINRSGMNRIKRSGMTGCTVTWS